MGPLEGACDLMWMTLFQHPDCTFRRQVLALSQVGSRLRRDDMSMAPILRNAR